MTAFDYVGGVALLLSGIIGWARGFTREVVTVIGIVLSAVLALYAVRFTGPIARHLVHTPWLANVLAIVAVFILVYVCLRVVGSAITNRVRETVLSGPDRMLGFGVGLMRGLAVLGAFALFIHVATPPKRVPAWFLKARLYPVANLSGSALRTLAPRGFALAKTMEPRLEHAIKGAGDEDPTSNDRAPHADSAPERGSLDVPAETSR
jgi:membrane protein required for colicin V production